MRLRLGFCLSGTQVGICFCYHMSWQLSCCQRYMLSVIKYSPSESAHCLPCWPPRGLRQAAQGLHASWGRSLTVYLPFLQAWAPWNFFFPPHVVGNVIATSPRPSLYFLGSLCPSFQILGVVTGFTGSEEAPKWS